MGLHCSLPLKIPPQCITLTAGIADIILPATNALAVSWPRDSRHIPFAALMLAGSSTAAEILHHWSPWSVVCNGNENTTSYLIGIESIGSKSAQHVAQILLIFSGYTLDEMFQCRMMIVY